MRNFYLCTLICMLCFAFLSSFSYCNENQAQEPNLLYKVYRGEQPGVKKAFIIDFFADGKYFRSFVFAKEPTYKQIKISEQVMLFDFVYWNYLVSTDGLLTRSFHEYSQNQISKEQLIEKIKSADEITTTGMRIVEKIHIDTGQFPNNSHAYQVFKREKDSYLKILDDYHYFNKETISCLTEETTKEEFFKALQKKFARRDEKRFIKTVKCFEKESQVNIFYRDMHYFLSYYSTGNALLDFRSSLGIFNESFYD